MAAVRRGKDPSLFTVVFEDSAALLGLFVAFLGVLLSDLLEMPVLDGAASVVIGLILVSAAIWLAEESRSLLVGEVADPEIVAALREIAMNDPAVMDLGEVLTMHLGPDQVLLNIEVEFSAADTGRRSGCGRAPDREAHPGPLSSSDPHLRRGAQLTVRHRLCIISRTIQVTTYERYRRTTS